MVRLGLVAVEQPLTGLYRFIQAGGEVLACFELAKKLFAYEEHSNAEAVPFNILVVTVAGANLLAVLNGIATEGHSRAVAVAVLNLVLSQAFLHYLHHIGFGEELVSPSLHVLLREDDGTLQGLFHGQLTCHVIPR